MAIDTKEQQKQNQSHNQGQQGPTQTSQSAQQSQPSQQDQEARLASTLAKVASAAGQATVSLTAADITNIITAAIRASKEPTPAEAAKAAQEAQDAADKRAQLLQEADEWRVQRAAEQDACDHKKPRGEDCLIGKLFSDGHYRVMCLRCQKWLRDIVATPAMIQQVMQAENLGVSSWENFGKFASGFINSPDGNTASPQA